MPYSGKTFWLADFAAALNMPGVDLDQVIEAETGKSIADLFKQKGESYFRSLEQRILSDMINKNETAVIAAGGGTPCFNDNLKMMKREGVVVSLTCTIDLLQERAEKSDSVRPLLNTDSAEALFERLNKTFLERKAFYEQADLTFDPITDKFETTIQKIKMLLLKYKNGTKRTV